VRARARVWWGERGERDGGGGEHSGMDGVKGGGESEGEDASE
jgi:hypothetical protein